MVQYGAGEQAWRRVVAVDLRRYRRDASFCVGYLGNILQPVSCPYNDQISPRTLRQVGRLFGQLAHNAGVRRGHYSKPYRGI